MPLNESSARCASGRGGSPDTINFSGSDKSNWRKICGPRSLITVIVSLGYHRTINYPLKMAADLQSRISSGGRPLPIRQLFIHRCRMTMIVLLSADRVRELVAGHNGAVSSLVQDAAPRHQRALLAVARAHHEISFNCLFVLEQHKATVHSLDQHEFRCCGIWTKLVNFQLTAIFPKLWIYILSNTTRKNLL